MKKFGRRLALTAAACAAVGLGGCLGEDTKEAAKKAGEQAAEAVEKAAKDAAEATKKAAEAVKETTKAAAEKASEAAAVATEKAREATAAAKEKANEVVAAAKQDADPAPAAEEAPAAKEPPAWARGAQMNPDYTPAPKVTKSAEPAAAPAAVETAATEPKAEEPKPEATTEAAPAPAAEETVVAEAEKPAETTTAAAEETPAEAEAKKEAAAKSAVENHDKDVKWEDGRYRLEDGTPTYKVTDGVVDWASWEGFRRYHDACHVCHGPNALGGSFAPSLADSLKTMSYDDFVAVVAGGRVADRGGTQYVMPALGGNPDVMCYLDDIYTYIKGRSAYLETSDAKTTIPPGRPIGREDISDEARQQKKECLPE